MSKQSFNASLRTLCSLKPKSASSTLHLSPSWGTSWDRGAYRWTLPRCQLLCPGPSLTHVNSCNGSWGSLTSSGGSSVAIALWLPHSQPIHHPKCCSSGPPRLRRPSRTLRPGSLLPQSFKYLTLRDSLLWRWTPPTSGWEPSCSSGPPVTRSSTPAPSFLGVSPQLKGTMTLGTESCWLFQPCLG